MKTIAEAQKWAAQTLNQAGVENAARESEILMAECMRADRIYLMARPERLMDWDSWELFQQWIERRLKREPLAYIIGKRWFYGLELRIQRGALIPRPETELLVERFLSWQAELETTEPPYLLDAGTGSGCIAIACLLNAARWRGIGVDASPDALKIAHQNRERFGLTARLELLSSHWLESIEDQSIHSLLSNPPYVRYEEWETLAPEVKDWEPFEALVANREDPLLAYRELIAGATRILVPRGLLALEVGVSSADEVAELMKQQGFSPHIERDLQNLPRLVWSLAPHT